MSFLITVEFFTVIRRNNGGIDPFGFITTTYSLFLAILAK